jgi:hypothetical protein
MEVEFIGQKYNVQNPLNSYNLISEEVKHEGLIGKIIYHWSKIKTSKIVNENNEEVLAVMTENENNQDICIEFKDVSVKILYSILMGPSYKNPVVPKRCPNININWSKQWKFLWSFRFFSPTDRQFIHKTWNYKLWTYDNRASNSELICPLCLMPEYYFNHPLETDCLYTKEIFLIFQKIWFLWTSFSIPAEWWNNLWISTKYIFKKQLFYAMVLLKRKIWFNYTSTIHNEDKFLLEKAIIYQWLGSLQSSISSILYIIQHDHTLLKEEKLSLCYSWSLNSSWATFTEDKWKETSLIQIHL